MLTLTSLALVATLQTPDLSWSGPLAAGKQLTVSNISGSIVVETAPGAAMEVTAFKRAGRRGSPADVEIRRVETADGMELCVLYPGMGSTGSGCARDGGRREGDRRIENDTEVRFVIKLPRGVHLKAASVSGDVRAEGLRGRVSVASVSGSIRLDDVEGPEVEARSVSGAVRLDGVRSADVRAETVSGPVAFTGAVRPAGEYAFTSVSGDVSLQLPAGTGAELSVSSMSGRVSSSFPLAGRDTEGRRADRHRLRGTIGNGGAELQARTLSGDISIGSAARP